jgi:hypothetical protein
MRATCSTQLRAGSIGGTSLDERTQVNNSRRASDRCIQCAPAQSGRTGARALDVVLPFDAGHVVPLRRAPDVREACGEAYGVADEPYVAPMRELLGIIGAHEWRRNGVAVPALEARIHPHYGVFAPIRGEYVDLVAKAPFPGGTPERAFDIGTGTGVLAAVLVRRGVARVVATDNDARAIGCARDNFDRLGMSGRIECVEGEFFPAGRARLIVCNPPWIPGEPSASIERAIFDRTAACCAGSCVVSPIISRRTEKGG